MGRVATEDEPSQTEKGGLSLNFDLLEPETPELKTCDPEPKINSKTAHVSVVLVILHCHLLYLNTYNGEHNSCLFYSHH